MRSFKNEIIASLKSPGTLTLIATAAVACMIWQKFPESRAVTFFVCGIICVIIVLWKLLWWRLAPSDFGQKKDFIDLFAKILGGSTLLVSLFFTWTSMKTTQDNLERTQATSAKNLEVAQQTLESSRASQAAERFKESINQLGNDKVEVRIGAIYGLGQLAKDSVKDHWPIMQVLTAYVRKNAPWDEKNKNTPQEQLRSDLQSVMNVLGTRNLTYMSGEGGIDDRLDLHGTDLRGLHLSGGENLEGASFREAHLENAKLRNIRLKNAILFRAHLEGAKLFGADLTNADLTETHLEGADLTGATGLNADQLGSAITDENTILPDYLSVTHQ
jgi:uncharacterized protein YjbI with pentapeptide repeats